MAEPIYWSYGYGSNYNPEWGDLRRRWGDESRATKRTPPYATKPSSSSQTPSATNSMKTRAANYRNTGASAGPTGEQQYQSYWVYDPETGRWTWETGGDPDYPEEWSSFYKPSYYKGVAPQAPSWAWMGAGGNVTVGMTGARRLYQERGTQTLERVEEDPRSQKQRYRRPEGWQGRYQGAPPPSNDVPGWIGSILSMRTKRV